MDSSAANTTALRAEIRAVQAAGLTGDAAARAMFAVMNGASAANAIASARATPAARDPFLPRASGMTGDQLAAGGRTALQAFIDPATVPPCPHYPARGCIIIATCCGQPYACRLCHDDAVGDDHKINRRATRLIICRECHAVQPPSNRCINSSASKDTAADGNSELVAAARGGDGCGAASAAATPSSAVDGPAAVQAPACGMVKFDDYYCDICRMWIGAAREAYHCDGCGICRVGGAANFFHCDACGMCLAAQTRAEHEGTCRADRFHTPCPVCREDLFSSRQQVKEMACGHTIHCHCAIELRERDYRCPVCRKSAFDMTQEWEQLHLEIAMTPLPAELQRTVTVVCYDCGSKSRDAPWHVFGLECAACHGFNTSTAAEPGALDVAMDGCGGGCGGRFRG